MRSKEVKSHRQLASKSVLEARTPTSFNRTIEFINYLTVSFHV